MLLRCLLLLVGLTVSLSAIVEMFNLSANQGEFNAKTLGALSSRGVLSASIYLSKFNSSKAWPTAAYAGFHQGKNRDDSIQFLIIRNQESDPYLVAGYRIIENGREVKVESLANIPLDAKVQVQISIESGLVTLRFGSAAPVTVRTSLTEVSPYVSVSSGTAEFNVVP